MMTARFTLWIFCLSLLGTPLARAGGSSTEPSSATPPPSSVNSDLINPYSLDDYWAECTGRGSWTYLGDLLIANPVDAERYRCIRFVIGDFKISTGTSAQTLIVPWLQTVYGNLELDGRPQLPRAKLPRLLSVQGDILIDTWNGNTRFEVRRLTQHTAGKLRVYAGSVSDLGGFDALVGLHRLELYNPKVNYPMNPQSPRFKGLRGLTEVGSMQVKLGERGTEEWDFLYALIQVQGSLEIEVDETIVGTHSIQQIGGQLRVEHSDMLNLAQLDAVAQMGSLRLYGNDQLNSVSALSNAHVASGGSVYIVGNFPLTDCQATTLANQIKSSTSSVTVSGNASCSPSLVYSGPIRLIRF